MLKTVNRIFLLIPFRKPPDYLAAEKDKLVNKATGQLFSPNLKTCLPSLYFTSWKQAAL